MKVSVQYRHAKACGFFLVFFRQNNLEKQDVEAFCVCVALPEWQNDFLFCFVTQSALTKHSNNDNTVLEFSGKEKPLLLCQL